MKGISVSYSTPPPQPILLVNFCDSHIDGFRDSVHSQSPSSQSGFWDIWASNGKEVPSSTETSLCMAIVNMESLSPAGKQPETHRSRIQAEESSSGE